MTFAFFVIRTVYTVAGVIIVSADIIFAVSHNIIVTYDVIALVQDTFVGNQSRNVGRPLSYQIAYLEFDIVIVQIRRRRGHLIQSGAGSAAFVINGSVQIRFPGIVVTGQYSAGGVFPVGQILIISVFVFPHRGIDLGLLQRAVGQVLIQYHRIRSRERQQMR